MTDHKGGVLERRREYLARAAEAQAKADTETEPQLKESWRDCAESWRFLARHVS